MNLIGCLKKDKVAIKFILMFFLASRLILVLIGVSARETDQNLYHPSYEQPRYNSSNFLDIWGQWDSGWYLNIAVHGYSANLAQGELTDNQANYAFFPLYPLLTRWLGWLINNPFIAGLIISNLTLLGSAFILYKLVLLDEDEGTARRAIKYLFLFPTAFIFSGLFTESLFLFLALAAFYAARKNHWWLAGIFGFLLSLTRVLGVLVCLPLFIILTYNNIINIWKNKSERIKNLIKLTLNKKIIALLLIPLGFGIWCTFNYYLTGDAFAFIHILSSWNRQTTNPLIDILGNLKANFVRTRLLAISAIGGIYFVARHYRLLKPEYLLYASYSILIPLSKGLASFPRYLLIIFPLYIIFAKITREENNDLVLTIIFTLIQGFLMAFWSLGTNLVI